MRITHLVQGYKKVARLRTGFKSCG